MMEGLKDYDLYKHLMDLAVDKCQKDKKREGNDYDQGKYDPYFEKIEKDIYGYYKQTYDSPFGDIWKMLIYKVSKDGIRVIAEKGSEYRFYHKDMFKNELAKIPYGEVK
jgi:hypothetical protein